MDMPMSATPDYTEEALSKVPAADIDGAVERTLAAMYKLRVFDADRRSCEPPHCQAWLRRNVTGVTHRAIARAGASGSVVLLQNNASLLPLTTDGDAPLRIAVLGAAAEGKVFGTSKHSRLAKRHVAR